MNEMNEAILVSFLDRAHGARVCTIVDVRRGTENQYGTQLIL